MTTALTPALALDYIKALSADVRDGVVFDRDGNLLAGPERLVPPARSLLDASPDAGESCTEGAFAARDDHHEIVVFTGPFALPGLTAHDLRTALAALRREGRQTPPSGPTA